MNKDNNASPSTVKEEIALKVVELFNDHLYCWAAAQSLKEIIEMVLEKYSVDESQEPQLPSGWEEKFKLWFTTQSIVAIPDEQEVIDWIKTHLLQSK